MPAHFGDFIPACPKSLHPATRLSRAQLLRPYPQFTDLIPIYSVGASSFYHSMQVTATKRYSKGLQMQLAYTWSKTSTTGSATRTPTGKRRRDSPSACSRRTS
jgi:hypothetical protein